MSAMMFGYLILISIGFYDFVPRFLLSFGFDKAYQTLKTLFDYTSKHLEVRQKYSATHRIFNSLVLVFGSVVKHGGLSCVIYCTLEWEVQGTCLFYQGWGFEPKAHFRHSKCYIPTLIIHQIFSPARDWFKRVT